MQKEIFKRFKYWFDRGIEDGEWNDGTKFFYFYLAFNILAAYYSHKDSDRQMLTWVVLHNNGLREAFEHRLEYSDFKMALVSLKSLCPLYSARDSSKSCTISDVESMREVVDVIYQIRCNLFHGAKIMNEHRNKQLVEKATYVLKFWLEYVHKHGLRST